MHTHDTIDVDRRQTEPRRGLLVWTAPAVIGLIALIAALILFWPEGDDNSSQDRRDSAEAAPDTAAVQTATAFVDALASRDADQVASYLTADVLASTFDGLEGLRLETRWQEQTGFEVLPGRCEFHDSSPAGVTVRCPYEFHGLRSEALGLGPYGDNYYDLTVIDSEIVSISDHIAFLTNGFSTEMWKPFARWAADRYPDDVEIMFTSPAMTMQRASEDSNRLWGQRTQEYADSGGA